MVSLPPDPNITSLPSPPSSVRSPGLKSFRLSFPPPPLSVAGTGFSASSLSIENVSAPPAPWNTKLCEPLQTMYGASSNTQPPPGLVTAPLMRNAGKS